MKQIQFVCPNCGAPITAEETTQKVVCRICGTASVVVPGSKKLKETTPEEPESDAKPERSVKPEKTEKPEKAAAARRGEAINPIRKSMKALRCDAEKRNENAEGGGVWRALDFLLYFMMVVLIMFSVRAVVLDPVRVEGTSMIETLADKEVMLVNRTAYAFSAPKRGDIVICYYPDEYYTDNNLKYATRVKRIVAVAGDRLELKDGGVYVNGERLSEPYLNGRYTPDKDLVAEGILPENSVVPEGTVFVMGDNRPSSRDSRLVGPIPLERVIGRAFSIVYPFKNFRLV